MNERYCLFCLNLCDIGEKKTKKSEKSRNFLKKAVFGHSLSVTEAIFSDPVFVDNRFQAGNVMQSQKAFGMPVQEYHESFWGLCVQLNE